MYKHQPVSKVNSHHKSMAFPPFSLIELHQMTKAQQFNCRRRRDVTAALSSQTQQPGLRAANIAIRQTAM